MVINYYQIDYTLSYFMHINFSLDRNLIIKFINYLVRWILNTNSMEKWSTEFNALSNIFYLNNGIKCISFYVSNIKDFKIDYFFS